MGEKGVVLAIAAAAVVVMVVVVVQRYYQCATHQCATAQPDRRFAMGVVG